MSKNDRFVALFKNIVGNYGIWKQNVLQFLKKYNKIKVLRISEEQHNTLIKMKSYNVDVSQFIRTAIKEKIKREYKELTPKPKKEYCPF